MDIPFVIATLMRRGMLTPGRPVHVIRQLDELRRWGYGVGGELRASAARSPHRTAVIDESGSYTYAQLLDRAERLAAGLRGELRIGIDQSTHADRVGLLCRNHAGLIVALAATSMLGVDAVLANTGLSPAQLSVVAAEQNLQVLIHDTEFREHAALLPRYIDRVDEYRVDAMVAHAPPRQVRPPAREGRPIMLTSGTTGTPKGARRPNPGGLGPLASIISRIPLCAGERALIAAPIFHTWGYAALQMILALRGTVVLQRRFDPRATQAALAEHDCSALFAVPVMVQRLLEAPTAVRARRLRTVAVSGSALPGGLATRFMDAFGDVLYNLYGSTEASWASIATPAELRRAPSTAGRPPHGTRVAILGDDGKPVPPGRPGTIYVANDMLFEGYTNGTRSATQGELMSTGDLGHIDPEGLLFVDGRQDDMIISGGENVFPSEVEDLIAGLPQVLEVAVVGVPDLEFGQRLAAWIVLRRGERLDAEAVREYVRRNLARFSVPRDVRFLDALPRNATGKVVPRLLPW
ncbi:MAG TPA: AMP-binding protein [Rugosimonospora sp.]|nr:AMP-binding protein [Rugosimonospora sp.]